MRTIWWRYDDDMKYPCFHLFLSQWKWHGSCIPSPTSLLLLEGHNSPCAPRYVEARWREEGRNASPTPTPTYPLLLEGVICSQFAEDWRYWTRRALRVKVYQKGLRCVLWVSTCNVELARKSLLAMATLRLSRAYAPVGLSTTPLHPVFSRAM